MHHIKLFEGFFRRMKFSTVTNTKEIWGYTREEVEDFFVYMSDEHSLSISIDFMYYSRSGYSYDLRDNNVGSILASYRKGIIKPGMSITFFTNSELNNKLLGGIDPDRDCGNLDTETLISYRNGIEKLERDIEDFMENLQNRMGYKINSKSDRSKIYISNSADIQKRFTILPLNSGEEIGVSILTYNIEKV